MKNSKKEEIEIEAPKKNGSGSNFFRRFIRRKLSMNPICKSQQIENIPTADSI